MIRTYPGTTVENLFLQVWPLNVLGQAFVRFKNRKLLSLIPGSNEIDGWFRENVTMLENNKNRFSRYPLMLLKSGAVTGAVQKFFSQKQKPVALEVALYDMRKPANAKKIYDLLSINTEKKWSLDYNGAESRIDDSRLLAYLLDLRKGRYFIRIIIDDKSPQSLQTAKEFVKTLDSKIEELSK